MRKENKNKIYIGLFIAFLMISSTIGFIYSSDSNEKYNGYSFTLTDKGWSTYDKNTKQYWYFDYLPNEVNFDSNIGMLTDPIYISLYDNAYFSELASKFALVGVIANRIDLEDVDCQSENSVLIFTSSNYNKIYKEGSCVYLEGYIPQLIDRLFYHILGVM